MSIFFFKQTQNLASYSFGSYYDEENRTKQGKKQNQRNQKNQEDGRK